MSALRDSLDLDRRRRMTVSARYLRDGGHLRGGVTLADAADVLWTYTSPELFELLVVRRGWSATRRCIAKIGDSLSAVGAFTYQRERSSHRAVRRTSSWALEDAAKAEET